MTEESTPPEEVQPLPDYVRSVPYATAVLAYKFMLSGIVSRLLLYLNGELDKELIQTAMDTLRNNGDIVRQILKSEHSPMRTVYDRLLELGVIEDQKLIPEAMLFINLPDDLKFRIMTEDDEARLEEGRQQQIKTWEKIRLNSETEPTASPYTLLINPDENVSE
ncbi:hypothetical protein LUCX_23 [Xanthomonas phage vB_XciM_LucasX]|nr:hypothetical protein LUCX_23 [Xanthomonas phage vB_XciM_LucasX]